MCGTTIGGIYVIHVSVLLCVLHRYLLSLVCVTVVVILAFIPHSGNLRKRKILMKVGSNILIMRT